MQAVVNAQTVNSIKATPFGHISDVARLSSDEISRKRRASKRNHHRLNGLMCLRVSDATAPHQSWFSSWAAAAQRSFNVTVPSTLADANNLAHAVERYIP